ncbi:iron chelate uptake ABC transporter family permease subunit [Agrococcus sp. TF02-05]|uniref:iron chelate uptake ABC transporter family permease subunit n=1 Tax=Agrococcus sp. TF02-05 TaxID=2815211 RepID=UPI001AA1A41E|nr:iron chelate uptake ABC transporter family permease subunit [Agrococcus sp. TF02-05]MBO1769366.1 iron chelate uptake ABC transporter family permease subunit [Agrococcus sp. TF02-05]
MTRTEQPAAGRERPATADERASTATTRAAAHIPAQLPTRGPRRRRSPALLLALALGALLVVAVAVAASAGPAGIGPLEALGAILARLGVGESPLGAVDDAIVVDLRLPRALAACAVGAGLAIVGAIMQALVRNPLADPYLLGVSSGASVGAVLVLIAGLGVLLPVAAFVGALAALLATLGLAAAAGGATPTRTVLAGVVVASAASALVSLVIFWGADGDAYREILAWLLGSLAAITWPTALVALAGAGLALALLPTGRLLDALALGDSAAGALGVDARRTRWALLIASALVTGVLVSVSGAIGFIGLVVPHAVRLAVGAGHARLLPLSALAGALVLLVSDTVARAAFDPRELPVGIVTALIGAPVFAALMLSGRVRT